MSGSDDEPKCGVPQGSSSSDEESMSVDDVEKLKLQEQQRLMQSLNRGAQAGGSSTPPASRTPAAFAKRKAMSVGSRRAGKIRSL